MYVPAIASIGARLVLQEGFGDVSFRLGGQEGRSSLLLALLYPVVVGFLAYRVSWAAGFAKFQLPLPPRSHLYAYSPVTNLVSAGSSADDILVT